MKSQCAFVCRCKFFFALSFCQVCIGLDFRRKIGTRVALLFEYSVVCRSVVLIGGGGGNGGLRRTGRCAFHFIGPQLFNPNLLFGGFCGGLIRFGFFANYRNHWSGGGCWGGWRSTLRIARARAAVANPSRVVGSFPPITERLERLFVWGNNRIACVGVNFYPHRIYDRLTAFGVPDYPAVSHTLHVLRGELGDAGVLGHGLGLTLRLGRGLLLWGSLRHGRGLGSWGLRRHLRHHLLVHWGRGSAHPLRRHGGSLLGDLVVYELGSGQHHGVVHVHLGKLLALGWRHLHKVGNDRVDVHRGSDARRAGRCRGGGCNHDCSLCHAVEQQRLQTGGFFGFDCAALGAACWFVVLVVCAKQTGCCRA